MVRFKTGVTSLVAQAVKPLTTMQETWVRSLGREDPLEKEMATHSSILAWKIPWMEEPGRLQSMGSQKSWTRLSDFTLTLRTGVTSWPHKRALPSDTDSLHDLQRRFSFGTREQA